MLQSRNPEAGLLENTAKKQIVVIGAGITGLVAAYRLLQSGFSVILLESTLQLGGMAATFQLGNEPLEYLYHHIFTSDRFLIDLAEELGVDHQLTWYNSREALYIGERLYPFVTPFDLIRFREIPFPQRIQTGLTVLRAAGLTEWQALESCTAADWLSRQGGRQAYEKIWQPLLFAKFEDDAEKVSAVWIWNKFKLRGHSREKSSGQSKLGYMTGGFGTLATKLADRISAMGGRIYLGHTATDILHAPDEDRRFTISCILSDCNMVQFQADGVIATIAGRQFANIAGDLNLSKAYAQQVFDLHYKGNLCVVLRLRKSLSPYYWTTVCDDLPFVVVVEHTNLTGPERYGGHVVYLSRYLDAASPLWTESDGEIFRLFTQALNRIFPDFTPDDILDWRLRRTRYAQPVIGREYSKHMPAMDTTIPFLKLAGMAQIYPEDRGMNYAVRLGQQAAEAMKRDCMAEGNP